MKNMYFSAIANLYYNNLQAELHENNAEFYKT